MTREAMSASTPTAHECSINSGSGQSCGPGPWRYYGFVPGARTAVVVVPPATLSKPRNGHAEIENWNWVFGHAPIREILMMAAYCVLLPRPHGCPRVKLWLSGGDARPRVSLASYEALAGRKRCATAPRCRDPANSARRRRARLFPELFFFFLLAESFARGDIASWVPKLAVYRPSFSFDLPHPPKHPRPRPKHRLPPP